MATRVQQRERERALLHTTLDAITDPKRVAGIDFSMSRTGLAVVYSADKMHTDHVGAKADPNVWGHGHRHGLHLICERAAALVAGSSMPADLVMVEAPFAGKGNNDGMMLVAHFEGLLAEHGLDVPIVYVVGSQLKVYAAGTTKDVDKAVMALAARDRLGWQGTVHDQADALWLACFGWALLGRPVVELPKRHTAAVERRRNCQLEPSRTKVAA